jgi:hypothetical protein
MTPGNQVRFLEPVDAASALATYTVQRVADYNYVGDGDMIYLCERPGEGWCATRFLPPR